MASPINEFDISPDEVPEKKWDEVFSTGVTNFTNTGSGTALAAGTDLRSPNFTSGATGWQLDSAGNLEANDGTFRGDLVIGGVSRTISSTDDIQTALDALNTAGGGTLYMKAGTWTVTSDITMYSSVSIVGISQSQTIIDFDSNSASMLLAGTSMYTTGTITSVTVGGTQVNGSSTSWLANVSAGQQIFINNEWHLIAAVTGDTTIILAEPYVRESTYSGTYRAGSIVRDIAIERIMIKNSAQTAIDMDDVRNILIKDILLLSNNKGFTMDNAYAVNLQTSAITNSTSNGYEITNANFPNLENVASAANGGHGVVLNNVNVGTILYCAADGNTSDGVNMTDVTNMVLSIECSDNGGQGMELVSGCNQNQLNLIAEDNTSDGVKLTATSDNNKIETGSINSNGAYGINIAAATCDNTTITGNHLASNSSGSVNDSGTGTMVRGNVGVSDNETGGATAVPPGVITPYGGSSAPSGWLLCDGTTGLDSTSDTSLADLYTIIGTTFGGTGAADFDLPDMRGNFPLGKDNMGGASRNRVTHANADTVGSEEGSETHALTTAELASHSHVQQGGTTSGGGVAIQATSGNTETPAADSNSTPTQSSGSGTAHENMSPYMTLNYIIKK